MLYELPLLLLTNVISLSMALVILFARTISRSLRGALIMTIASLALWQDMIFIADNSTEHLLLLNNLIFLWPTVAVIGFYSFLYKFNTGKHIKRVNRIHGRLSIAFTIGTVLQIGALLTAKVFETVTYTSGVGYVFTRGYGYYFYIIGLLLALVSLVIHLLASVSATRKQTSEHRALVTVLYTVSIASLWGVAFNIIFPIVTNSQHLISLGVITIDIFAIGFTLSVVRGQLLDIKLYAVRTVVYILSIASLAAIYVILAFSASQWLFGSTSTASPEQAMLNVGLALLLAFVFQPIKQFFDRITNRLFFRDNYNTSAFYARLSRLLTSTTDLRGLLQQAAGEVSKTLKSEYGLFFVYDKKHHVTAGTTNEHRRLSVHDARAIDSYVVENGDSPIITELLADQSDLRRLLTSYKVAVALPLQRGDNEVVGYFLLGEHLSSNYTRRDIRALGTIADELVIAIQNALSVQEVKELNATLQQRIDEATKELRESNAQLQRLDEAKDEFVSMASHQLRTPLTSVKGYLSMVLEGDAGKITDAQQHLLSEAFTSSERMVHLINDFLNVSRLQTGKFMIDRRPIDLAKITGQEVNSLKTTAKGRNLRLQYRKPSYFPTLYIDEGKIRQVIMNFIDNAIYYSSEHSTIIVELEIADGNAILKVNNEGIGVPKAEQAHLFTKFFRAANARKQRPDGTGVGLYLAKKVVTAHSGDMLFESAEGEGTTFGFRLPIKKLSTAPPESAD
jgi:signal transduction histidine kinase